MKLALLDQKQKIQRWLGDKDIIEAQFDEAINRHGQLMFSVPISKGLDQSIMYVAVARPQGSGYVLFKIVKPQVMSDRVQYTAIEAAYDEMKSYAVIRDVRPQNRTAGEMLALALMDTRWTVGVTYTKGTSSTNFYYITPLEAIQKIAGIFSLEVTFEIDIDRRTNQITRRRVNLYAQQGDRTGKRFEYGSNLLTVTREENTEDLITALIGRGKGEEVSEGGDDSPDGYGRRITFADVVWSKKNGNPADKPAGIEYVEDVEATKAYGFSDGKPRIGIQVFEEITDPAELLQATWSALQSLKRPQVSFKADVLDVGDLKLGDTVAIIRHDIGIEYFTRVYKVTHNLLDEKQNTIELGDDFSSRSMTSTIASMSGAIEKVKEKASYAATSANGKNTNFYSQDKPAYATEGDLWYKDLGNGETDLYQYHDGNWILISSTRELNQAKKEINQQLDNLKQLEKDKGIDIYEIKKNMKSIEDTANQAFRNGETNRTDLTKLDGEITGRVTQVLTNGGYATQSWTQGQFKLNNDSFNVWIGNVLKTANGNADKIAKLNIDLAGIQSTVATKVDNTIMATYVKQQWDSWKVEVDKKITDGTSNLMSKINVEAGSILFQSKKLFLAAESTVFGGSAFIPDAAIAGLDADKIKTGTLDAGKVSVINLNAGNISTGNLNAMRVNIVGKSAMIKMNGDYGMDLVGNDESWFTGIHRGELTFGQTVNNEMETIGAIRYGAAIDEAWNNGINIVIETQEKLGKPYGGNYFSIGTAVKKDPNGTTVWSRDFLYNAVDQNFHFNKETTFNGNVRFADNSQIWFNGAQDPFFVQSVKWNGEAGDYYYPTIRVGYSDSVKADSGIAFRWTDIKVFGAMDTQALKFNTGGEASIRMTWIASSSFYNSAKIPFIGRLNDPNRPTGSGTGIAFAYASNLMLRDGSYHENAF